MLLLCSLVLSGCDFFRALAGRPLSAEIEAKREMIERQLHEKEQRRLDSLNTVRRIEADSLASLSRLAELSAVILEAQSLGGLVEETAPGYSIVVGSFKNDSNAEKLAARIGEDFGASVKAFNNGMFAVTVCNCFSIKRLAESYDMVLNEKFCPSDVWILKN